MAQTQLKENNRLAEMVRNIANTIHTGTYETEDDSESASDYLEDALDIQYIISSDKEYLGARVLVAFGGPNIWIDTVNQQVEGYWWGDKCIVSYNDAIDLDATLEELFNC